MSQRQIRPCLIFCGVGSAGWFRSSPFACQSSPGDSIVSTFSTVFDENISQIRGIVAGSRCPSTRRTEELLNHSRTNQLGVPELAELLEIGRTPAAREQFDLLRNYVLTEWRKPRGNVVRYVAPVYVSSFCVDACGYCNFSASRQATIRKRLSLGELRAELDVVLESGARVIELVLASDPEFTTDLLLRCVEETAAAVTDAPGGGVLLCSEYLSREAYSALKDAGLTGIVQWDETLDPEAYMRWHASSPHKRNFYARMDNHDRAQQSGLVVATGALLGLADYRFDVLMQIVKARHLAAEYGRGPFVFGAPRLKPVAGHGIHLKTTVTDLEYETILMVYRIAVPSAGRWLQTRETFAMNLSNVLDGDVLTYRCGEVKPGGYVQAAAYPATLKDGQFGVNELGREFVERELEIQNFRIDYAWMEKRSQKSEELAGHSPSARRHALPSAGDKR